MSPRQNVSPTPRASTSRKTACSASRFEWMSEMSAIGRATGLLASADRGPGDGGRSNRGVYGPRDDSRSAARAPDEQASAGNTAWPCIARSRERRNSGAAVHRPAAHEDGRRLELAAHGGRDQVAVAGRAAPAAHELEGRGVADPELGGGERERASAA